MNYYFTVVLKLNPSARLVLNMNVRSACSVFYTGLYTQWLVLLVPSFSCKYIWILEVVIFALWKQEKFTYNWLVFFFVHAVAIYSHTWHTRASVIIVFNIKRTVTRCNVAVFPTTCFIISATVLPLASVCIGMNYKDLYIKLHLLVSRSNRSTYAMVYFMF